MSLRPEFLPAPGPRRRRARACRAVRRRSLPAPTLIAQAPAAKPAEPGWVQLFNGKDLTGWVKVGQEQWTVEDGAIVGVGVTKEYGYLRTEQKYIDFDLRCASRSRPTATAACSSIPTSRPASVDISQGLQFEIDRVLNHHTGGLYGDGRKWVVWPAPELETVIRPTDWNEMRMRVVGRRYISCLNGTLMVDFTDPTPKSFDGYISLQLHSGGLGRMRFKDIYIRDLTRR